MYKIIMTFIVTIMLTLTGSGIHQTYKKETCEEKFAQQLERSVEFIRIANFDKLNQEDKYNLLSSLEVTGLCGDTLSHNKVIAIKDKNAEKIDKIKVFLAQ